ncbi:MAG: phenylalanine--tRNA ligase subunit beta [Aigarchaeota archaeon]|nr:phenylalanine--tRNA ligase subunit beta [Aigarchaeota archaeon]MDW7986942.1 phenylalanine--tRNA ligase subunit beta [Nitrososphaerota archaeon]
MPILTIKKDRFWQLIGKTLSDQELTSLLHDLGLDVEEVSQEYFRVEYNPNRPDYSSIIGIARAARGLLEVEVGLPRYRLSPPKTYVEVDVNIRDVRPYIVSAIVKKLKLDEEKLEEIINMQEDLHWILGRDRRKVSIGLHNLDVLEPPFKYLAVKGDEYSFVPLGGWRKMTLEEILLKHEKGLRYGHIVKDKNRYPLIIDSRGEVLSFPPIINSSLTELTPQTENLFIDITGTDLDLLHKALNILTTALNDLGGRVEQVKIIYPDRVLITPNYKVKKWRVETDYINSLLGLNLSTSKISKTLKKMRFSVKARGNKLTITPPPYRVDIMHIVDFVEDVAIGLGYDLLQPRQPKVQTYGSLHIITKIEEAVREIMIGLGYVETMNFTLTNERDEYEKMMVRPHPHVKLLNPVSSDYTILRTWILPSLMRSLYNNRGSPYPQKIFEVGEIVEPHPDVPEKAVRKMRLGCVSCHTDASYSEIKSVCEEILKNLSIGKWSLEPYDEPPFFEGRAARIIVDSTEIGYLGEIHPNVLENWEITLPVSGLEIFLHNIIS